MWPVGGAVVKVGAGGGVASVSIMVESSSNLITSSQEKVRKIGKCNEH